MKLKIALILGLALIAACYARPAEDYEYEEEPAAPAKPAPRSNPLLNRRNPLSRNAAAKPASSTTQAPVEEVEEELSEDEPIEEEPAEATSTTESGRRIKGGIVRPFRSNQDLLETLKKRREQVIINKSQAKAAGHDSPEAPAVENEHKAPKKSSSSGGRGRYNKKETSPPPAQDEEPAPSAAPKTSGRRFRN